MATKKKTQASPTGATDTTLEGLKPPLDADAEASEGLVIGEGGSITRPTVVSISGATFKKPSDGERIVGKALLEGDTYHGFQRKIIVELTEGVTQEGAFNVFKGHFPDAIQDGFQAKGVTAEEAQELLDEWREAGAIPGVAPAPAED